MLEKIQNIEGLDIYQDFELFDDTPPGETIVKFQLVAEDMPFLTAQAGHIVRKNFVYIYKEKDLGRTSFRRRIRDGVEFDEATNKWVIKKLAPNSDIKQHPNEWNAFYRGTHDNEIGSPLLLMFKNDPSRVEFYKSKHIITVEQLARVGHTNATELGMGVSDDVKKAKMFLQKIKEQAPVLEMNAKLEEKDKRIAQLEAQVGELAGKLTELIDLQLGNKSEEEPSVAVSKRRGRPKGSKNKSSLEIEGMQE